MWGKRTTFLSGRSGSSRVAGAPVTIDKRTPLCGLLGSDLLQLLLRVHLGFGAEGDGLLRDDASLDLRAGRNFEHGVQQDVFDDALQAASAGPALQRLLRNRGECGGFEDQLHVIQSKELLVLLDERVL